MRECTFHPRISKMSRILINNGVESKQNDYDELIQKRERVRIER